MDIQSAVKTVLANYANFKDRSGRGEFWWWVLAYIIGAVILGVIAGVIGLQGPYGGSPLSTLYSLALLVPNIAISVRRMHDIGKSGWWVLIGLIPLIGWLVLIYFYVKPSEDENRFGSGPLSPAS